MQYDMPDNFAEALTRSLETPIDFLISRHTYFQLCPPANTDESAPSARKQIPVGISLMEKSSNGIY